MRRLHPPRARRVGGRKLSYLSVRQGICMALALLCIGTGCVVWQGTRAERSQVHIVFSQGVTARKVEEIRAFELQREDGLEFVAWKEDAGTVQDAHGGRSARADVVVLCGSSEQLFPGGRILHREDLSGCLIGEALAEQLFGSHNVEGLTLDYADRRLVVRGVLHGAGKLLAVQAEANEEGFDRMILPREGRRARRQTAERFAVSYGLEAKYLCFEWFDVTYWLEAIPGKWSDFSGWRQSLEQIKEDFRTVIAAKWGHIELACLKKFGSAMALWSAGTACFSLVFLGKGLNGKHFFVLQQSAAVDDQKDPGGNASDQNADAENQIGGAETP